MSRSHRTCEICGLKERHIAEKVFFARFPQDEKRCADWLKAVGKEDLAYLPIEKLHELKYVCGRHFTARDFTRSKTRLKKRAVPTLNLRSAPLTDNIIMEFLEINTHGAANSGAAQPTVKDESIETQQLSQPLIRHIVPIPNLPTIDPPALPQDVGKKLSPKKMTVSANQKLSPKKSKTTVYYNIYNKKVSTESKTVEIDQTQIIEPVEGEQVDESEIHYTDEYDVYDSVENVEDTSVKEDRLKNIYSWQRKSAVVPCGDDDTDEDTAPAVDMDVTMFDADHIPGQAEHSIHKGFKCNHCQNDILGFRYTCVQCLDYDLCHACEANREHPTHYALRIPPHRPLHEIERVLQTIRRALTDSIVNVAGNDLLVEIKDEVEMPDPIHMDENVSGEVNEDMDVEDIEENVHTDTEDAESVHTDVKDFKVGLHTEDENSVHRDIKYFKESVHTDIKDFKDSVHTDIKDFKESVHTDIENKHHNIRPVTQTHSTQKSNKLVVIKVPSSSLQNPKKIVPNQLVLPDGKKLVIDPNLLSMQYTEQGVRLVLKTGNRGKANKFVLNKRVMPGSACEPSTTEQRRHQ